MTSEEYEATLDPFRRLVYRAGNGTATADETYQLRLYIQNPMTAKQDRIDAQTALRRGGYTDTDPAAYNRAQDEYYKGTTAMETLSLEQIIEIDVSPEKPTSSGMIYLPAEHYPYMQPGATFEESLAVSLILFKLWVDWAVYEPPILERSAFSRP